MSGRSGKVKEIGQLRVAVVDVFLPLTCVAVVLYLAGVDHVVMAAAIGCGVLAGLFRLAQYGAGSR